MTRGVSFMANNWPRFSEEKGLFPTQPIEGCVQGQYSSSKSPIDPD